MSCWTDGVVFVSGSDLCSFVLRARVQPCQGHLQVSPFGKQIHLSVSVTVSVPGELRSRVTQLLGESSVKGCWTLELQSSSVLYESIQCF